jgi:hypothetical protein
MGKSHHQISPKMPATLGAQLLLMFFHAVRNTVDVRDKLTAQSRGVGMAVTALLMCTRGEARDRGGNRCEQDHAGC